MTLFEVYFSFEFLQDGEHSIVYPSKRLAIAGAKNQLKQEMDERKEEIERFQLELTPNTLTAEISEVIVCKITKQMFCNVINSNGGQFVQERKSVAELTLNPKWKSARIVYR